MKSIEVQYYTLEHAFGYATTNGSLILFLWRLCGRVDADFARTLSLDGNRIVLPHTKSFYIY